MAKRTRVRDQDQFIVRLPDGMRERIKAKADLAGISMNEAIVRVLEQEFPEPLTMERRVSHLLTSLQFLKGVGDADYLVDDLIKNVRDTLVDIVQGRIEEADEARRHQIAESLRQWDREQAETEQPGDIVDKLKRLGPVDSF